MDRPPDGNAVGYVYPVCRMGQIWILLLDPAAKLIMRFNQISRTVLDFVENKADDARGRNLASSGRHAPSLHRSQTTFRPCTRRSGKLGYGHEDAFPRPEPSDRCGLGQETFAGMSVNG